MEYSDHEQELTASDGLMEAACAEITITQLDGRVIQKEHIMNARFKELQLSESPGLYLVTVTSGNQRAVFKLSKK